MTDGIGEAADRVGTRRGLAILLLTVGLGACATIPADRGRADVDDLVTARGQPLEDAVTDAAELLRTLTATPLSSTSAVRIALINNPELQATYASLGFGAAEVYEAGRVRNPVFSVAVLRPDASDAHSQITLGLVTSLTDLITLPARKRLAATAFAALKQSVGAQVLSVAATAETRYYDYVAAQQMAALRRQIAKAGDLSAALAGRFHAAGNISARELALERAAAAEARLAALDADAGVDVARAALAEVLGLTSGESWSAPAALPAPLAREDDLDALLGLARESRLDLASARSQVQWLADRLGVENWSRWLGDLEVGAEYEREVDGEHIVGPTLAWELPVFTQHGDALLRAEADWRMALAEVRRLTVDVDNGVRLAYATVGNAKARMREYREGLIPARSAAVVRAQEEVNFMLIGIFELIAIKQQEYDAFQAYLESVRDYWIARVDLSRAVGATLPSSAAIDDERIDVDDFVRPAAPAMDHSMHGMPGKARPAPPTTMDHSKHRMANDPPQPAESPHQHH